VVDVGVQHQTTRKFFVFILSFASAHIPSYSLFQQGIIAILTWYQSHFLVNSKKKERNGPKVTTSRSPYIG
jgi:hypothetical protein